MMKLLLTRLLPGMTAVGIFGAALSPVQPTLNLFEAAANALAGETEQEVDVSGLLAEAEATKRAPMERKRPPSKKRAALDKLADQLEQSDEDAYGWKAGDRGMKPIALPGQPSHAPGAPHEAPKQPAHPKPGHPR